MTELSATPPCAILSVARDSCQRATQTSDETLRPLNQAEVECLGRTLLDLRDGGNATECRTDCADFQPSSNRAPLEILGTLGQRFDECRARFEPGKKTSVVECVLTLERFEQQCATAEQSAARGNNRNLEREIRLDRETTGRLVSRLRTSRPFVSSVLLLSFTLAQACAEDWRLATILRERGAA